MNVMCSIHNGTESAVSNLLIYTLREAENMGGGVLILSFMPWVRERGNRQLTPKPALPPLGLLNVGGLRLFWLALGGCKLTSKQL